MLFVISAPSGAGKTTIVRRILEKHPELVFSVSATSRPKRENETEGVDYFFLSKKEFEDRIDDDDLVEFEKLFNDHYYGTLKTFVDDVIQKDKDLIFDIDVKGALSLKKIYGGKAVLIFIKPPDKETLRERLKNRGTEPNDHIEERLKRIDMEMEEGKKFDHQVVNDDLDKAVNEVEEIILN
ncbi:MAG TPA: guanylate kinase [Ignavibacteria bacterium]|nr:guanylate kinase [Ignavibacteria bacterium]